MDTTYGMDNITDIMEMDRDAKWVNAWNALEDDLENLGILITSDDDAEESQNN